MFCLLLVVFVSALSPGERDGLTRLLTRFPGLGDAEKPWFSPIPVNASEVCLWSFLTCDAQNHVTEFEIPNLPANSLIGQSRALPSDINKLTFLEKIKLNNISLIGSIPTILLPSLKIFDLSLNTGLTSSLPTFQSSPIEVISFISTGISSSIPTTWGLLSRLTYINLDSSPIMGTIPTHIGDISTLMHFEMNTPIDSDGDELNTHFGSLVSLTTFKIIGGTDRISGKIPNSFRNLVNLQVLNLNNNDFEESFPTLIFDLRKLTSLDLGRNNFDGGLPSHIGLLTELQTLNLYDNQFSGPLPSQYGNLKKLRWFRVDGTSINGQIPASYDSLADTQTGLLEFEVGDTDIDCCYPPLLHQRSIADPSFMDRLAGECTGGIDSCFPLTPTPTPTPTPGVTPTPTPVVVTPTPGVTPTPTPAVIPGLIIPEGGNLSVNVPTTAGLVINEGTLNVNSNLTVTGNLTLTPGSTTNINSSSPITVSNCASFGGTLTAVLSTDHDTLFNFTCHLGEFETVFFYNQSGLPVKGCISLSYGDKALTVGVNFSCEENNSSKLIAVVVSCAVVGSVLILAILLLVLFKDRILPYTKVRPQSGV